MTTAVVSGNDKAQRLSLARWKVPLGLAVALVVAYLVIAADAGNQAQAQYINALTIGAIYALIALGLHDGLRHHRAHQLRPRRRLHGRLVRVAGACSRALGFTSAVTDPVVLIGVLLLTFVVSMLVMGVRGRAHRAVRLPAAAQRAAPGAADHGHRRQLHPPEHRLQCTISNSIVTVPQLMPNYAAHDRPHPDPPDQPVRRSSSPSS